MGYWYMYGTSDRSFQDILAELHDALQKAGTKPDGSFELEVIVRGKGEERRTFNAKNIEELSEMLKMNIDKMA